jgi:predicted transposase/invertase (TIGR01784 family)
MNKEQYAEMLRDISETNKAGGSVSACIAKYKKIYNYVYIYNDNIFKRLFGTPENEPLAVDLLNAVLKLDGGDCIEHLTFVDPSLPDAFAKSITSDIVALDQRQDRIVLEVQHVDDDTFKGRLVYYSSKHVIASRVKGDNYNLRNLNLVSLQMFDGYPDPNKYRHSIRFRNDENEVFYDKETITLVEIPKFLKNKYEVDNSRLAQWLRVFDGINNESPIPVPEGSHFALLQEKAKLSIFTEEFLVSEAMRMSDHDYELYVEKKHARAEGHAEGKAEGRAEGRAEERDKRNTEMALDMLADNKPIDEIVKYSHLSMEKVLELRDSQATFSAK